MENNIIKLVTVISASDGATFQEAKCKFFGKQQTLKMLGMYGISYRPPDNSFGIAFSANGYDNNIFVIADRPKDRFSGLEKGELKIGNYLTGAFVHFKANNSIEISSPLQVDITSPDVNISGDLTVIGDVTGNDFKSSGISVDFNTHVHAETGSITGVPQ